MKSLHIELCADELWTVNSTIEKIKSGKEFLYICKATMSDKWTVGGTTQEYFDKHNQDWEEAGEPQYKMHRATKKKLELLLKGDSLLQEPENNWNIRTRVEKYYLPQLKQYIDG